LSSFVPAKNLYCLLAHRRSSWCWSRSMSRSFCGRAQRAGTGQRTPSAGAERGAGQPAAHDPSASSSGPREWRLRQRRGAFSRPALAAPAAGAGAGGSGAPESRPAARSATSSTIRSTVSRIPTAFAMPELSRALGRFAALSVSARVSPAIRRRGPLTERGPLAPIQLDVAPMSRTAGGTFLTRTMHEDTIDGLGPLNPGLAKGRDNL
jgi:hypothetical protein